MLKFGSKGAAVADLQRHLNTLGFKLGVDGDFGAQTRFMVMAFQKKHGLDPDGIVGPNTIAALNATNPKPPADPSPAPTTEGFDPEKLWWVVDARKEMGQKEIAGSRDNPRIVMYHSFTTLKATDDETAWCSSFMCFLFGGGTKSAAAKSWATWGQHLDHFIPGCICVYTRPGGNHVNIGLEQNASGSIRGLGGNQGNRVSDNSWQAKNTILAFRWPPGIPIPVLG